jgi:hypothetical protein
MEELACYSPDAPSIRKKPQETPSHRHVSKFESLFFQKSTLNQFLHPSLNLSLE